MRVLTFTTLYPNAEKPNHGVFVENRLRQTLARHDVQSTVLAPVPYFPFTSDTFGAYARFARVPAREVRFGIQVHHPRYFLIPKVGMNAAPWLLYRAAKAACARLGLNKNSIDVIDAHYFYPDGVAAALLARHLDIPFVVTARGTDLNVLPQFPLVRRQIVWAAQQAAAAITVSGALKQKLLELGVDRDKSAVLRNGVDLDLFKPVDRDAARRRLGLPGTMLLSVGNLVPLKGHELTIEAMASLKDCTLIIAGGGPLREALQARANSLGVGDRVRLLGEVPHAQLPELYSAADAFVLMSEREGWANVLLEAMACGTPALATPVGGNGEIVAAAAAGALLRDRAVSTLVDAVVTLRQRAPDRAATRKYAEGFSWGAVAAANFALLSAASKRNERPLSAESIVARAMRAD
ncbi:MAG: glycosyltransferase family 4 protein [Alphaproteobacteria bacterium]|nr:glycosyltransferase family 4 protein [Alphaproteobacteria bacterium]